MQSKSRLELYREFMEYIHQDIQGERKLVTRRIFSVFLWCFILPASISLALILMIKFGIIPRSVRRYLDWLILVFPLLYSLYVLSIEVLSEIPSAFRRGGIGNILNQAVRESEWRERICTELQGRIGRDPEVWRWLVASFRIELLGIQHRSRYLTALAGAVFFLLLQGIDSLGEPEGFTSFQGWFESSSNSVAQFVGLGLFLVLFYLSGNQSYHSLVRYQRCAELVADDLNTR